MKPAKFLISLSDRNYRWLWTAMWFWYSARWMELIVLAYMVLVITASPAIVGSVTFVRLILVMSGPLLGLVADLINRYKMIFVIQLINLLCMLTMFIASLTNVINLPLIYIIAGIMGLGYAAASAARRPFVAALVTKDRLTNAVSIDTIAQMGSKVAGPLLAGLVLSQWSTTGSYLIISLMYLVGILVFVPVKSTRNTSQTGISASALWQGIQLVTQHNILRSTILLVVLMNLFIFPFMTLLPTFARDVLFIDEGRLGVLAAADGIGAVIGTSIVAYRSTSIKTHGKWFAYSVAIAPLCVALFAISNDYILSFIALIFMGICLGIYTTMEFTLILLHTEENARGRAMGILTMAIGNIAVGWLIGGLLAEIYGPQVAVLVMSAIGFIAIWIILLTCPDLWKPTREHFEGRL